jgi:hypothetical protein
MFKKIALAANHGGVLSGSAPNFENVPTSLELFSWFELI